MEECTNIKGGGGVGGRGDTSELHLVHKAFSLLSSSGALLEDLAAWSSPAAAAATITTQIPVLRSQLHRSHNLGCPFLLPHHRPTTQASDSGACSPTPPERQQLFPLHARAQTHKHGIRAPTGGHMPFFSSRFPFFSYHSISSPSLHPEKNPLAL